MFYGLGLNSAVILTPEVLTLAGIGDRIDGSLVHTPLGMYQTLRSVAGGNLLVSLAGLLSGYYATFFLVDIWGRRPIQFMGFAMLTVILAVLGKTAVYRTWFEVLIGDVLNSWHLPWSQPHF